MISTGLRTSAVGEAIVTGATLRACSTNHVGFALTLAAECVTLKAECSLHLAVAGLSTAVIVRGQREDRLPAELRAAGTE